MMEYAHWVGYNSDFDIIDMFDTRSKKEIFLKADAGVPYGDVVKTMADIKGAGIERLGMVTEPDGR